jgi:GNAT superfamily N-acetyltransferase
LTSFNLRLESPDDAQRIVEIYNHQERGHVPLTVARYQGECAERPSEHPGERYVATQGGQVIGFGGYSWAWWTGNPATYTLEVRVDPGHCRQGIGKALFHQMHAGLLMHGATELVNWIRADATGGIGFAARLGFQETGRVIQDYHLPIAEADTRSYDGLREQLIGEGLWIGSLAELGRTNEHFLRALQTLWANSDQEAPDADQLQPSFDAWRQQVLDAPGLTPDTHWVALDGDRPVGMTFLKRLSDSAYENDYTGVASTHRGRGIATLLKLYAIQWAQQDGVEWFLTSSEIGNHAMIRINTRSGYRPGAQRREFSLSPLSQ